MGRLYSETAYAVEREKVARGEKRLWAQLFDEMQERHRAEGAADANKRIAALEACLREYMADCLECVHAELPVWCGKCVKAATLLGPGASAPKNNPINL